MRKIMIFAIVFLVSLIILTSGCIIPKESCFGGVSVTQLRRRREGKQFNLWDFLDPREEKLTAALDALRDKYGEGVVTRASLLKEFSLSSTTLMR